MLCNSDAAREVYAMSCVPHLNRDVRRHTHCITLLPCRLRLYRRLPQCQPPRQRPDQSGELARARSGWELGQVSHAGHECGRWAASTSGDGGSPTLYPILTLSVAPSLPLRSQLPGLTQNASRRVHCSGFLLASIPTLAACQVPNGFL